IFRLRECHDRDIPQWRPHQQLLDITGARIGESDLVISLDHGWELARDATASGAASPITPMTRIAPSIRAVEPARLATHIVIPTAVTAVRGRTPAPARRGARWRASALAPSIAALVAFAAPSLMGDPQHPSGDRPGAARDAS